MANTVCNHEEAKTRFCPECGEALGHGIATLISYLTLQARRHRVAFEKFHEPRESLKGLNEEQATAHRAWLKTKERVCEKWEGWLAIVEGIKDE